MHRARVTKSLFRVQVSISSETSPIIHIDTDLVLPLFKICRGYTHSGHSYHWWQYCAIVAYAKKFALGCASDLLRNAIQDGQSRGRHMNVRNTRRVYHGPSLVSIRSYCSCNFLSTTGYGQYNSIYNAHSTTVCHV